MKISAAQATEVNISEVEGLTGNISLIVKDMGDHRGELRVSYGGYHWGTYWGSMGTDSTLAFIAQCDEDYLLNRLCPTSKTVEDMVALRKKARRAVLQQRRAREISKEAAFDRYHDLARMIDVYDSSSLLRKIFGDDWQQDIPTKTSGQYTYYISIMKAIREAACELSECPVG